MHQMVRDKEREERSVSHLVETQVMPLFRVVVLGQTKDFRQGRAYQVIHNPTELAKLFDIVKLADFHNVVFILGPSRHTA